jgi:hypothetical protein
MLVEIEDGDGLAQICLWLLTNTSIKAEEFDPSVWIYTPKPGDVIRVNNPHHALLKWGYDFKEKGENTLDEKMKVVEVLLESLYGEEDAAYVVAGLARQAARKELIDLTEMSILHTVERDTKEVPAVTSTWGEEHVSPKE